MVSVHKQNYKRLIDRCYKINKMIDDELIKEYTTPYTEATTFNEYSISRYKQVRLEKLQEGIDYALEQLKIYLEEYEAISNDEDLKAAIKEGYAELKKEF